MVVAVSVSENSTNVRPTIRAARRPASLPLALRVARAGFRVLGPSAPSLASRYAERLFLTARRHRRPAWEEQALATADERFTVPHEGKLLPAWRWGDGARTVLLVHGWEGRGSQMAAFVEPLVRRGFSVVAFDVLGHGDAPAGIASLVEHARAVASVGVYLRDLRERVSCESHDLRGLRAREIEPLHGVIAHSVGGAASLYAMRLGFDAGRLALIAPPTSPSHFAAGFGAMLHLGPELLQGMVARLERRYGVTMADLRVVADAERFPKPLLVVHDAGDRVVDFDEGKAIAEAAPGGRLVTTQGLGHSRVLRDAAVIAEIVPFVAEGAEGAESAERTPAAALGSAIETELFYRDRRW